MTRRSRRRRPRDDGGALAGAGDAPRVLLRLLLPAGVCAVAAIAVVVISRDGDAPRYGEPYRPQVHYSAARNWLNDPNGLVYHRGEYHLFYQYNAAGSAWEPGISWGHAVSRDLVHWEELPVAIPNTGDEAIFSGSAVVDVDNTSGFGMRGRPAMVAVYTSARPGSQAQSLAYSTDDGRTWTKYTDNPVLDIGAANFRDPKVFWYEPDRRWIMTVALPEERKVAFYASRDLKAWEHLSDFGPANAVGGIWECPDLVEMPVGGDAADTRWMLTVSLNPGGIAGGSGTQYFVGEFDGRRFETEDAAYTPPGGDPVPGYGSWTAQGEAFAGVAPDATVVDSFHGDDAAQGTLTSPPFVLSRRHVNVEVAGGASPETAVRLVVGGEVVRTASGRDSGALDWAAWDVGEFAGREARIELADAHGGPWGHVLAGRIVLADEPALPSEHRARWLDYGADNYAGVTFNGTPGDRPVMIGWMSNWLYGTAVPTSPWRGAMTMPRLLALQQVDGRVELVQQPPDALAELREEPVVRSGVVREGVEPLDVDGAALDVEATFALGDAERFGLEVHRGQGERTIVGYDTSTEEVFVDRAASGRVGFHDAFAAEHRAPLPAPGGEVQLRVLVDASSVEVFAADGRRVITDQVFPGPDGDGIAVFAAGGSATLERLAAYPLRSVWR